MNGVLSAQAGTNNQKGPVMTVGNEEHAEAGIRSPISCQRARCTSLILAILALYERWAPRLVYGRPTGRWDTRKARSRQDDAVHPVNQLVRCHVPATRIAAMSFSSAASSCRARAFNRTKRGEVQMIFVRRPKHETTHDCDQS